MVAFAADYAPTTEAPERRNRARGIFLAMGVRAGENDLESRFPRREKAGLSYETASGPTNFLNRDPINEPGSQLVRDVKKEGALEEEKNLYAFVGNDPLNKVDLLGLNFLPYPMPVTGEYPDFTVLPACAREIISSAFENKRNRRNPGQAPVNYRHVHCYWSCRIAKECGEHVARELGILNELIEELINKYTPGIDHTDEIFEEATMIDFASNEIGIDCAGKGCCNSCCAEQLGGRFDSPLSDDLFP